MIEVRIERPDLNPDRLHADLQAALKDTYLGLSFDGRAITVHLTDGVTPDEQGRAAAAVRAHDPAALTDTQRADRDRDLLPFFRLGQEELIALAEGMEAPAFRREIMRAFAHLRDLVVRGGGAPPSSTFPPAHK